MAALGALLQFFLEWGFDHVVHQKEGALAQLNVVGALDVADGLVVPR
jgi:hypothetical protein